MRYFLLVLTLLALVVGPVLAVSGCKPAQSPAREAIQLVSDAVLAADDVCSTAAVDLQDRGLAEECAKDYTISRQALVTAEQFISLGDDKNASCFMADAADSLKAVAMALHDRGVAIPNILLTAVNWGPALRLFCHA